MASRVSSIEENLYPLPPPPSWAEADAQPRVPITKESLAIDGVEIGLVLRNVLTRDECEYFIKFFDLSQCRRASPSKRYRNCGRVTTMAPEVASVVYDRVRPFLAAEIEVTRETQTIHRDFNDVTLGRWKAYGLNPAFRLCKYDAGGHFAPHYDGERVVSSSDKSLQTFMIYLNDGFRGGGTNFLHEHTEMHIDDNDRIAARKDDIKLSVQPEPGLAIIFNHRIMHEGGALLTDDCPKYMMRSEIMFNQVLRSCPTSLSANDEKALQLVVEADLLESNGMSIEAADCWRRAFKLSRRLAEHYSS